MHGTNMLMTLLNTTYCTDPQNSVTEKELCPCVTWRRLRKEHTENTYKVGNYSSFKRIPNRLTSKCGWEVSDKDSTSTSCGMHTACASFIHKMLKVTNKFFKNIYIWIWYLITNYFVFLPTQVRHIQRTGK